MTPGQPILIDRSTHATYIRSLGNGTAIVAIGTDTRVIEEVTITPETG